MTMDTVTSSFIIGVEGLDEVNFIRSLATFLELSDFEVVNLEGKNNFSRRIPALVNRRGFRESVKRLLIIRDADRDAASAFQSVADIVRKSGLQPPRSVNTYGSGNPQVGVFIMPDGHNSGMLEDLCMQSVAQHPIVDCVDIFLDCVSSRGITLQNKSKARAHAFLSAMPECPSSVGIAALKGHWNFDSPVLSKLSDVLRTLRLNE